MLANTQVSGELKQRIEAFLDKQNFDSEAAKLVKVEQDIATFYTIHTSTQEITLYEDTNGGLRLSNIEALEIPIDLHEEEPDEEYDDEDTNPTIKPTDYQDYVQTTVALDLTHKDRLGLAAIGLAGEVGEVCDLLKKHLYHRNGKPFDHDHLVKEVGDVLWYISLLLTETNSTFEEVMQVNMDKLKQRHPAGFQPTYASDSNASVATNN